MGRVVPHYVTDIGWPASPVDAGRKESRVYQVKMVCREGESSVQVVHLHSILLATVRTGSTRLNSNWNSMWIDRVDGLEHGGMNRALSDPLSTTAFKTNTQSMSKGEAV